MSAEVLDLIAQGREALHVAFQKGCLPVCQRQHGRRQELLADHRLLFPGFHKSLVIHLFVSRVLVDDVEGVVPFRDPVGAEDLAHQPHGIPVGRIQERILSAAADDGSGF